MKHINPSNPALVYCGRIDFEEKDKPVFVFACSYVTFRTDSREAWITIENLHSYYQNSIGILVDGEYKGKVSLADGGNQLLELTPFFDGTMHEYTIYKTMDSCHMFVFHGLDISDDATLLPAKELPKRRIEVYGDSVSAGEVSEVVECTAAPDPENHNGVYNNSFYSYSWMTARKLNARIHDIAQGGIALLDGHGYFNMPETVGMLSVYDKMEYNPSLGPVKQWDFKKYIPQVVVIAIGQNDNHPVDYMKEDYDGEAAKHWRGQYLHLVKTLRGHYPDAHIILTTTILNHDGAWDRALEQIAVEAKDPGVHHFLYEKNGCGTPGHIRIPEADRMSDELAGYINGLGIDW